MKYYNYPNLRKIILEEINYPAIIRKRLRKILLFFLENFYNEKHSVTWKDTPYEFVKTFHLDKWEARTKIARQEASFLKPIFESEIIKINDCNYFNPSILLKKVREEKLIQKNLTPDSLYYSHGDLHCNNILCGFLINDFILLDCRGKSPNNNLYYDVAYDVAKLYHDLRSLYSLIEKHYFTILMFVERGEISIKYDFNDQEQVSRFYGHFKYVKNMVMKDFTHFGNVHYRAGFTEALLYLSMVPMHLKKKSEGLMCLVTGIVRLNEWFATYHEEIIIKLSTKIDEGDNLSSRRR